MGLFDRSPAPPAWAQPLFDRKSWGVFRAELARAVTRLDPEAVIDDDNALVELSIRDVGARVSIKDLAATCAGNDPAEILAAWSAELVARVAANLPPATFAEAAPLLRVQLYSEATRGPGAIEMGPKLWFSVVVDTPEAMVPVVPAMLEQWGVEIEAVLEAAYVNMAELPEPELDDAHAPIHVAHGDGYLAATGFATLEDLVGDTPHGALVTFPTRQSMLFLPLDEMPSDVALRRMVLATEKLFDSGEDSVSRELYWCTPDLELVIATPVRTGGAMAFVWPPGLDELLAPKA